MEIIKVGVFHFDIFISYGTSIRLIPSPSGRHHACQSVLEVKCSGKLLRRVYLPQCIDLCSHNFPLNATSSTSAKRSSCCACSLAYGRRTLSAEFGTDVTPRVGGW